MAASTTAVVIAPGSHKLTGIEAFSIAQTTPVTTWIKLYDATTQTCGSGTPLLRYYIPGSTTGTGFITTNAPPDIFTKGIIACFTTGFADSDTTAPAANTFSVNFHWQ